MTTPEQFDEHKQKVIQIFDKVADGYDNAAMRFFPFTADRAIKVLQPRPGQKILDVATGTGAVALTCAQAVQAHGRVTGIDLAESMLAKAQANARKLGITNYDQFLMDADSLEFRKDYFDGTICSFALFLLPDMARALAEWRRVTKPGGRVVFTSFGKKAFLPMMTLFAEQLADYDVVLTEDSFSAKRLSEPEVCEALLCSAGFDVPVVEQAQVGYHLQSADDWWTILYNSGARGILDRVAPDRLAAFKSQHLSSIQALFSEKGLWLDVEILISSGVVD